MDTILIFGLNCRKGLIFLFLCRLSLLNFDLNGAAEPPAGRGPTGKRGRPAGKRGPSGEEHALLAWPDGGIRLCRRGGANMGRRWVGFGAPCWRGPTLNQGFAGGPAPTWAGGERESGFPVGVARRWIKALSAGRRQQGSAAGEIKGESDVDALVFPPHASTPLSELMHEYRFSIPCITSNHFYTIFLLLYFQPGIKVMHKQLFSAFRHHILPFPPASFL